MYKINTINGISVYAIESVRNWCFIMAVPGRSVLLMSVGQDEDDSGDERDDYNEDEEIDPDDPFPFVPYIRSRRLMNDPPQLPNGMPGMTIDPAAPYGRNWQQIEFDRHVQTLKNPLYVHVQTVAGLLSRNMMKLFADTLPSDNGFTQSLITPGQATHVPTGRGNTLEADDARKAREKIEHEQDDDLEAPNDNRPNDPDDKTLPDFYPQTRSDAINYLVKYGRYNQHTEKLVHQMFAGERQYTVDWASDFVHSGMQFLSPVFTAANELAIQEIKKQITDIWHKHINVHNFITHDMLRLDFARLVAEFIKQVEFSGTLHTPMFVRADTNATIKYLLQVFSQIRWDDQTGKWTYGENNGSMINTNMSNLKKSIKQHEQLLRTLYRGSARGPFVWDD